MDTPSRERRAFGASLILAFLAILYVGFALMVSGESGRSEFRGEPSARGARQTDPRALCEIDALNLRLIEFERQSRQENPAVDRDELQRRKAHQRPFLAALARSDCQSRSR